MKNLMYFLAAVLMSTSCFSQSKQSISSKLIGGPCEDCDALYDYKLLNGRINSIDTLQGFIKYKPKIKISGRVLQRDGKTPARNVILYLYQTNLEGIYEPSNNPIGYEKRHGKFRSWIKTDADGRYTFYTFRPAPYPNSREPAHIHLYIKERGKNVYYVDSYIFSDDPWLTEKVKRGLENRAGSGILTFENKADLLIASRDIILGFNIPDY